MTPIEIIIYIVGWHIYFIISLIFLIKQDINEGGEIDAESVKGYLALYVVVGIVWIIMLALTPFTIIYLICKKILVKEEED